ncbi:MAG: hypothetical protein KDK51_04055 [Deltaproteobacteria bacterium]|nr:hypothetical protein [Deltaproteobacteria bacterium]
MRCKTTTIQKLALAFCILQIPIASAQEQKHLCAVTEDIQKPVLQTLQNPDVKLAIGYQTDRTLIPITVHIGQALYRYYDPDTFEIREEIIDQISKDHVQILIDALNQATKDPKYPDLQFYISGYEKLSYADIGTEFGDVTIDDTINDLDHITTTAEITRKHNVPERINLYFVESVKNPSDIFPSCGVASFPHQKHQGIFISTHANIKRHTDPGSPFYFDCTGSQASPMPDTLIHEFGHFFGLLHTHHNGQNMLSFGEEERVSRDPEVRNCHFAGDGHCDTAADPGFFVFPTVNSLCQYTDPDVDPFGDLFAPPIDNFMSYYPEECRTSFSQEQLAFMDRIRMYRQGYDMNQILGNAITGTANNPASKDASASQYPRIYFEQRFGLDGLVVDFTVYSSDGKLVDYGSDFLDFNLSTQFPGQAYWVWDMQNKGGQPVSPGVYIIALSCDSQGYLGQTKIVVQ